MGMPISFNAMFWLPPFLGVCTTTQGAIENMCVHKDTLWQQAKSQRIMWSGRLSQGHHLRHDEVPEQRNISVGPAAGTCGAKHAKSEEC